MSRASAPLLRAILRHIDGIAVFNKHKWYGELDIDPELAKITRVIPRRKTLVCKALRRARLRQLADALSTAFAGRLARQSDADIVFAYIGTDSGLLRRTAQIAQQSGKAYVFYVVDDFLASLRITGANDVVIDRARRDAAVAIRGAKHVFAITDGLGEQVRRTFDVATTTLELAFEPGKIVKPAVKLQVVYVGSINFLYTAGLLDLFRAVGQVREKSGADLTVRLVCPESKARIGLGELPAFVHAAPERTAEGLASEIASSLCAFLPYSFEDKEKPMVSTSFPSKSLEYLGYARSIVVYGPDYGVTSRRFRSASLPSVVASAPELEDILRVHVADHPDYSAFYTNYLRAVHSLEAVGATFCKDLGVESC
jgi:hypothetical protein